MRKSNREIKDLSDILGVLEKCEVGRLGLSDRGIPYVVPLHFVSEEQNGRIFVFFHCANEGRKLDIIRVNPVACFEADRVIKVLRREEACGFTTAFESVIGLGKISAVEDEKERVRALALLVKKFGFKGEPEFSPQALALTTVLKLELDEVSGKRHAPKEE